MTNIVANERDGHLEQSGHVSFSLTYDDTGAEVTIVAPYGWKLREVIERGYKELGETPRPGDRVEANGESIEQYLDMHVKEFVARGIAPDLHLNVVSDTGGASQTFRDPRA